MWRCSSRQDLLRYRQGMIAIRKAFIRIRLDCSAIVFKIAQLAHLRSIQRYGYLCNFNIVRSFKLNINGCYILFYLHFCTFKGIAIATVGAVSSGPGAT